MSNLVEDSLEKKVHLSMLYDFYGELLKEHNREIYEDYMFNDLSLSEIADEKGMSRQGVHDIVKRTNTQLMNYEKKLGLMKRYEDILGKVSKASDIIQSIGNDKDLSKLSDVDVILKDILKQV